MSEKVTFNPEDKPIYIACKIIDGIVDQKDCLDKDPIDILDEIACYIEDFCRLNRRTGYPRFISRRYEHNN